MERIDDLLAELARTHKIALSPDDPVAMLITINRFLLRELAVAQEQMVQEFREGIATSASDWNKLANKRAEAILNATILAAKHAVAAGVESSLAEGLLLFQNAVQAASRQIEVQHRATRRLIWAFAFVAIALVVFLTIMAGILAPHR